MKKGFIRKASFSVIALIMLVLKFGAPIQVSAMENGNSEEPVFTEMIRDVSVTTRNGVRAVEIEIDREFQEASNRIIFDVNRRYVAESFEGRVFYSFIRRTEDTAIVTFNARNLTVGDEIRVRLSSGRPGQASNVLEYMTVVITEEMLFAEMIRDVNVTTRNGNLAVAVEIDRAFQEASNRIIFDVNRSYAAESFEGRSFYSSLTRTENTAIVTFNTPNLAVGDEIRVRLSSGRPGHVSNVQAYITVVITEDMLLGVESAVREWVTGTIDTPVLYRKGELVHYNGNIYRVLVTHENFGDRNWSPESALSLFEFVRQASTLR